MYCSYNFTESKRKTFKPKYVKILTFHYYRIYKTSIFFLFLTFWCETFVKLIWHFEYISKVIIFANVSLNGKCKKALTFWNDFNTYAIYIVAVKLTIFT